MGTKVIQNEPDVTITAEQCDLLLAWLRYEDAELYDIWISLELSVGTLSDHEELPVKLTNFLRAHLSVNGSYILNRTLFRLRRHIYETFKKH